MLNYTMRIVVIMSATLALHTAQAMQRRALTKAPLQAQDARYTDLQQQAKNLNKAIVQKEGPCLSRVVCRVTHGRLLACDHYYEGGFAREPEFLDRAICALTCQDVVDVVALVGPPIACASCAPVTTPIAPVAAAYCLYTLGYCWGTKDWGAGKERKVLAEVQEEMEQIEYSRWAKEHPELVGRGGGD